MRLTMTIAACLLSSAAAGQTVVDGSDAKMPGNARTEMLSQLQDVLRDADKAKIRRIHRLRQDGPIWCGEINAPNGMGGMTGFDTFTINMQSRKPHVADASEPNDIFRAACFK